MTVKKDYTCDLCGQNEWARKMYGVRYNDISIFLTSKEQTNTHICERCIESIKNFNNKG